MDSSASSVDTGDFKKNFFSLRAAVSQKRVRFQDGEFDLDLSYITREIIAMGLPGSQLREKLIRNDEVDVANMLNKYHPARYMIFNLSEKKYSYELFHNAVIDCGWPDHHPPTLYQLFEIINTMVIFLRGNPDNVVVVHCKAGKGRTGTIIVCLLIYCGLFDRESALKYFAYRRGNSTSAKAGVTIPSQLRYVEYFDKVLHGFQMSKKAYMLHRIVIHGVPVKDKRNGVRLFVKLYQNNTDLIYSTSARPVRLTESDDTAKIDVNVVLKGDILVRFKAQHMLKSEELFRCNFHTGFVGDTLILSLGKYDLDDAHKDSNVDEDFRVELIFSQVGGDEEDEGVRAREVREEGRSRSGGIAFPASDATFLPLAGTPPVLPPRGPKPPLPRRQATVAAESGISPVPMPVSGSIATTAPVSTIASGSASKDMVTDTQAHASAGSTRSHATACPSDARTTQRTQHLRATARGLVYVRADGSELLLSDEEAGEQDTRVSVALSVGKHPLPMLTHASAPVPVPIQADDGACTEVVDEESDLDACVCEDSDDERAGEEEDEKEVNNTESGADTATDIVMDLPALSSLPCLPSHVPSHTSTLPSLSLDDDTSMECPTYHTLTPTLPARAHADAIIASGLSSHPHNTPTTPALPSSQHTSPPFPASSPRVLPAQLGAVSPQLRAASPFSSTPAHKPALSDSAPSSPFVPAIDGKPDEHGDALGSLSSLRLPRPLSPQRTSDSTSSSAPPTYTNPTSPTSSVPSPTPRLSQLLAQAPTRKSTLSEANYEPWRDAILNRSLYTGLLHTMVYSSDTVEARKEKEKLAKTGKSSGGSGISSVDARLSFGERGRSVGGDEGGRQHTNPDVAPTLPMPTSTVAPLPPPPPQRPQRTGRLHAHAQTIAFTPQMLASARASIDQGVGGRGVRAVSAGVNAAATGSDAGPTTAPAATTTTVALSAGVDIAVQPVAGSTADANMSTSTGTGGDNPCALLPPPAVDLATLPHSVTAATDVVAADLPSTFAPTLTGTTAPTPTLVEDIPTTQMVTVSSVPDAHVLRGRPRRLNAPVPHDFPSMLSHSALSGCDNADGDVDSDVDNAFLLHDPLSPDVDSHASPSAYADSDDIAELHGLGMYANMSLTLAGKYSYTNSNSNANSLRDDADLDVEPGLNSSVDIPRSSTLISLSSNDSGSSKQARPSLPSKHGRIMDLAVADMRRRSVKLDGDMFGQARDECEECEAE